MATLNTYEPDSCCGRAISKALRADMLNDTDRWECPKCGMLWTPEMRAATSGESDVTGVRHWMPRPYFEVMKPSP